MLIGIGFPVDSATREYATSDPRGFLAQFPDGAVLDEVQRCPALFSYLQDVVDADGRMGRFILTGSQQFGLVEAITQSLAGRVSLLHLLPFSLPELQAAGRAPATLDALLSGGLFPPVHDRPVEPAEWLKSYVATYLERDVRQTLKVQDLAAFQRFIQLCAGRVGQLVNFTSLASDAGISRPTAEAWLSVLQASFLVFLVRPHLLLGLIHRVRTGGGIYHAELDSYLHRGGDSYLLNQQIHMPMFGKFVRAPAFFYMGTGRFQRFEKLIAGGTSLSWSQRWAIKALRSIPGLSAESAAIVIEEAVRVLSADGVFVEREVQENRVWGIPADELLLTDAVRLMTCRHCGHSLSSAEPEERLWENTPCQRATCGGSYAPQPPIQDYFGELYRAGDVVRIRSAEHTGMLSREDREWVEKRFMARPPDRRCTDPNLLSCTPTLEMGVNIGDLSSVVLCTVPPATANYVQRVGRAGRKEGAAVSLTIASAQPHDLYYFELPEDMMAGEIRPPGTFLNAPAVLERQFTAFCFDRWSEQANPKPVLPHKVDSVLETVRNPEGKTGFPYDFFHFIETNQDALLGGFLALFGAAELTVESRQTLGLFARGDGGSDGGLAHKILKRFAGLAEDREDMRQRLQKVGRAMRKNRENKARDEAMDAELDELKQHRDGRCCPPASTAAPAVTTIRTSASWNSTIGTSPSLPTPQRWRKSSPRRWSNGASFCIPRSGTLSKCAPRVRSACSAAPAPVIVARTHRELDEYQKYLRQVCPAIHQIETGKSDDAATPGLRLATIHRVKGLEFDHVILAGHLENIEGQHDNSELTMQRRALLYVAATRARKSLFVCRIAAK